MSADERRHSVLLHRRHIGTLYQVGDYTRFFFDPDYWTDPDRNVLGLYFEDQPRINHASALRVPPWFSNLLPEGRLREWIASDRGVSPDREMELLAQVGHDLPGAVSILPDEGRPLPDYDGAFDRYTQGMTGSAGQDGRVRFSLAGVGLKFSMLREGDRLTVPASSGSGDWIVKLPDANHGQVPQNEFAMMNWARTIGIEVPDIELFRRDALPELPSVAWPNSEDLAYGIRRFDRVPGTREAIHIEDLAQVRGVYPESKYLGSFETIAGLVYRGRDEESLREFVRRLTFNFLIGNGDSHLKNWSLIYADGKNARLSPAYDIVSTAPYFPSTDTKDSGLKFGGSKRFRAFHLDGFVRMAARLHATDIGIVEIVRGTVKSALETWPEAEGMLGSLPHVRHWIDENLDSMANRLP